MVFIPHGILKGMSWPQTTGIGLCLLTLFVTGCAFDTVTRSDSPPTEPVGEVSSRIVPLPTDNPDGLVAHWKLDESGSTAIDASGNGHHGTKLNGVGSTAGEVDAAASFDGLDDRIEVPDHQDFHFSSAMTVMAWVYPTNTNGPRTILNKWYAPDSYMLFIQNGEFRFSVALADGQYATVAAPAQVNQWTHVAGVFDGQQIQLYLNGRHNPAAIASAMGTLRDSSRPLEIGNHPSWNAYKGLIDDVQLYNQALNPTAIYTLAGCQLKPNCTDFDWP